MTKRKTKRPNVPEQALARARAEMNGAPLAAIAIAATEKTDKKNSTAPTAPNRPTARKAPTATVTVEDLKKEYVYVISDLRSMALLASLLFVALVIASLIFV